MSSAPTPRYAMELQSTRRRRVPLTVETFATVESAAAATAAAAASAATAAAASTSRERQSSVVDADLSSPPRPPPRPPKATRSFNASVAAALPKRTCNGDEAAPLYSTDRQKPVPKPRSATASDVPSNTFVLSLRIGADDEAPPPSLMQNGGDPLRVVKTTSRNLPPPVAASTPPSNWTAAATVRASTINGKVCATSLDLSGAANVPTFSLCTILSTVDSSSRRLQPAAADAPAPFLQPATTMSKHDYKPRFCQNSWSTPNTAEFSNAAD